MNKLLSNSRSFIQGRNVVLWPHDQLGSMYKSMLLSAGFNEEFADMLISINSYNPEVDQPFFPVDRRILSVILINYLSNAVKYSFQETQIDIGYRLRRDQLSIYVVNKGIGIPEDELDRVFEFGTRASNAVNSSVKGTGVGLGTCMRLAAQHRGSLDVKQFKQYTILGHISLIYIWEDNL